MTKTKTSDRLIWCIGFALVAATVFAFWSSLRNDFVNYDDPSFVSQNPEVQKGLSLETVKWAFRMDHGDYWHPIAWLSLLLDVSLFGRGPFGMHLTNLLLHVVNSVLVFLLLFRWTGALWRSATVGALFALHPLHVEAVAWITARKDVLSTLFWLLALWAYGAYAFRSKIKDQKSKIFYCLAFLFFVLGLMSKTMLVTLPFVMLLLDFWPLRRADEHVSPAAGPFQFSILRRLILEKLPYFVLSGLSIAITYHGQHRFEVSPTAGDLSTAVRYETVAVAYGRYLVKTLWPTGLSAYYPHPGEWPAGEVIACMLVLLGFSFLALRIRHTRPYVFTGWFWFVGTLVPVIGLTRGWTQFMADRFMYVPLIGLLVLTVWGIADLLERNRFYRPLAATLASAVLIACGVRTADQVRHWKNGEALFRHALDVTSNNSIAHSGLAFMMRQDGRWQEAYEHFSSAARINPGDLDAIVGQGIALAELGRLDEGIAILTYAARATNAVVEFNLAHLLGKKGNLAQAEDHYRNALKLRTNFYEAHYNLAVNLMAQSRLDEASQEFNSVLQSRPDYPGALVNLGVIAVQQDRLDDAVNYFRSVLQYRPEDVDTRVNLIKILATQGHFDEALQFFEEPWKLKDRNAEVRKELATALAKAGRLDGAIEQFNEVIRLKPDAQAHCDLALVKGLQGKTSEAIASYRQALALDTNSVSALNNLAWILATDPRAEVRDGAEAVRLAERACEVTRHEQAPLIGTLAAAYAEAGRFQDAIATAEKARTVALAAGRTDVAEANGKLLELYKAGRAYREEPTENR